MFERNQKSVFVLDHTRYFSISSEDFISLDFLKGKPTTELPSSVTGNLTVTEFSKSLWTCSVESSVEYCRIVWDLFPRGKLVRFIVSDTAAHIVNTWNVSTQNISHVLNAMGMVGGPPRNTPQTSDYSVIHGLRAAIEALAEPTDEQLLAISSGREKILNEGRVICITSARDDTSMKSLEDIFHTVLLQQNALASTQKKLLPIDHCHLVILNVVPRDVNSLVSNRGIADISPLLATEIHTVCAHDISSKLTHLIMGHYDLASTTVTNIPMKEEQNANSSANYDVEILHPRAAHTIICGNEALLPTSIKEGADYDTVTLKWCTPRGCCSSDLQPCLAQNRVTPVDVTSRPSSCLINFLLNGRSVLLEMPRKLGGKTTSHLLSARGGEIFIHSLQITRSCFEELPSINDGPGGRVQDYRVTDLSAFIKAHRFVPLKPKLKPEDNLLRARDRLSRRSRYFPLTYSKSLIYNLQRNISWLTYFLHKITKEDMDKADEVHCQKYIYELYSAATRGEVLPFSYIVNSRLKMSKKAEQYKLLYAELELLVRSYSTTPFHKTLLDSIQKIRAASGDTQIKNENNTIVRSVTESPLSPERAESNNSVSSNSNTLFNTNKRRPSNCGQRSLLDIVASAERSQSTKRLDFSGRLCTPVGQVAKLYPEFGNKEKEILPTPTNGKEEVLRS